MRKLILLAIIMNFCTSGYSQMLTNGVAAYGNEWIDYSNDYIKISVDQDAVYKISYDDLISNGFPTQISGEHLQMYNNGRQVPIMITNNSSLKTGDFLLFYGKRNDGEIDSFQYLSPAKDQLNPKVSLYTESRAYYLTWDETSQNNKRFEEVVNDLSGNLPQKHTYYMHREEQVYNNQAWTPQLPDGDEIEYSSFARTEGFGDGMKPNHMFQFPVTDVFDAPIQPRIEARLGTNIHQNHMINFKINDKLLDVNVFNGFRVSDYAYSFDLNDIKSSTKFEINGAASSDFLIVAHATLVYPRAFKANNSGRLTFEREANTSNDYYEIEEFSSSNEAYAFDLVNEKFLRPTMSGTTAKLLLKQPGQLRSQIVAISGDQIKTPNNLEPKKFVAFDNLNPQYLILTSSVLNNSENGNNPVEQYASFRSSQEGGSYQVSVINAEDIIDQFGYGIKGSGLAVRNFANYFKDKWSGFEMVFIIGKALDYSNKNVQTAIKNLVPTYGHPGSDNLMFAGPGLTYPYVGIGRLPARNQEEVSNYLRKIKLHAQLGDVRNKTIEERLWLKNIVHLSGGDPGNQQFLFNNLEQMRNTVENGKFGGKVFTFRKTSSDPVQTETSQDILKSINNGLSMLTFFGHSSAGTFDFSVEDPAIYENEGKLPIILSMGCNSGDIHKPLNSLSEKMVMTPDLGAIAFVASSGSAFPSPLAVLGKKFYDNLSNNFYGEPVGTTLRSLTEELYDPIGPKSRTLHEQNTLNGDPAIRLYYAEAPDYTINFSTVNTDGAVGTIDETITINFDIVNLGSGITDSLNNLIIHEYGEGLKDSVYFKTIAPKNTESVSIRMPNPGFRALGKNLINIIVDVDNRISEEPKPTAEENNDMKTAFNNEGFCFFIFDNNAFPIYPNNFGIVSDREISLKASSTNAFAEKQFYLIEIDTTENFDSPFLKRGEVFSSPSLIEWKPEVDFQHEVVYYWRVSSKGEESALWTNSSFVYLENSPDGWNQSHLYQWQKDNYSNYSYDEARRKFLFAKNISEVTIKNGVFPSNVPTLTTLNTPTEYLSYLGDGEIPAGVYISVFDGDTGLPWENTPSSTGGLYESELYTPWAINYPSFPYRTNNVANRAKVIKFLDEIVPDNSIVLFYTIQRSDIGAFGSYKPEQWPLDADLNADMKDIMTLLENNGAQRVRELVAGPKPYILVYKKGDPTYPVVELMANDNNDQVTLDFNILGRWFEGNVRSTLIGPSKSWYSLEWNIDQIDIEEDEYKLDVIGVKENGQEEILIENVDVFVQDLSSIDPAVYPYLRLNFYSKDEESRTSAQMDKWRILFQEVPEAVINVANKLVFESDTLFLGDKLKFSTTATNISHEDMDSLLVKYTIVDAKNKEINIFDRIEPVLMETSIDLDFEFDTDQLLGAHQFRVEINPERAQPEKFLFNNIGIRNFVVQGDRINPLLDVTFDGIRIMDGDIVSPRPNIRIDLRDENEFLLIKDISSFDLALQKLPDNQSFPINLNTANIVFTPADTLSDNTATLEYFPELETGEYILYVQAKDVSGNLSGDQDIEIKFRVIEDSQVSNVLNYPNPFSTSTQFIFTLTGYEVPEVFTIQIMTVTGKVVREITKEELGDLRIGLNRTEYKWNGTDEYGSKLATGVYLYRVMTSQNNEKFDQFINGSIDGFFKEGFGKLVIMR